jgi:hypothetical protein
MAMWIQGLLVAALFLCRVSLAQNLLANSTFNSNIMGWIPQSGTISYDSSLNASGAMSGSIKTLNNVDNPSCPVSIICVTVFPVFQCIPVTAGNYYSYGAKIHVPPGQASSGQGSTGVSFWSGSTCGGSSVGSSSSTPVMAGTGWTLSTAKSQAPPGSQTARFYTHNSRIGPTGVLQVNFDDLFFTRSDSSDCAFLDPGSQVPLKTTGFRHVFKSHDAVLRLIGTNVGATSVVYPFALILDYRTGSGSPITLLNGRRTGCFSSTPQSYVHLADSLQPGGVAMADLVFRTQGFSGGITVTWRTSALSGLR